MILMIWFICVYNYIKHVYLTYVYISHYTITINCFYFIWRKIQISYFKTCLIKVRKESGNRISMLYNLADFSKV